jgi:hypothetical protein
MATPPRSPKVYSGRGQGLKPIEQDFVLGKGGSVAGMVVNQGGRPVGGVLVGRYQDISKTLLRADNPNQVYPSGESKPDGSFEIVGLPDGATLSLIATKRGYIPSLTENVAVGKTDVKVVIREGEASIQGFVYDTDGKPAPDIPVKSIFMRKGARPDFFYPPQSPPTQTSYTPIRTRKATSNSPPSSPAGRASSPATARPSPAPSATPCCSNRRTSRR